jgi:hypothetical protein
MLENTGRATVKAVLTAVRPFHPEILVVEHKRGKGCGKIDRWGTRLSFTLAVAEGGERCGTNNARRNTTPIFQSIYTAWLKQHENSSLRGRALVGGHFRGCAQY